MPAEQPNDVNLGLEKLKRQLKPGEIVFGNALKVVGSRGDRMYPIRAQGAEDLVAYLWTSGRFETIRLVEPTFDAAGDEIPGFAAIVAKPKPQEE
ncbi:hypothetical protein A2Z00_05735 [Candidatus Gottesmanbacteria bacterium RBG_13_45_10]|uniref:Uncharacterized protein n=1 Tax=Candidatus Gottesmanbacteria bacterium RBG_13_45_10 TaxID=1798370 RepID=A0A1F5ZG83_9BACT|nr:MAG: hypothetical protein A2Z00_05735 [Candidatus Gottesmanbacteria bacterium RBG_13_45_10]